MATRQGASRRSRRSPERSGRTRAVDGRRRTRCTRRPPPRRAAGDGHRAGRCWPSARWRRGMSACPRCWAAATASSTFWRRASPRPVGDEQATHGAESRRSPERAIEQPSRGEGGRAAAGRGDTSRRVRRHAIELGLMAFSSGIALAGIGIAAYFFLRNQRRGRPGRRELRGRAPGAAEQVLRRRVLRRGRSCSRSSGCPIARSGGSSTRA